MRKCLIVIAVFATAAPLFSLGGIEGTMEYALDAPWRIEPSVNSQGQQEYGSIPIQVTIHDTDAIGLDSPGRTLGNFCSLIVEEETPTVIRRRHYDLDDLAEIETSGRWLPGSSIAPDHHVCRPGDAPDRCESLRKVSKTAEWHAVAWYSPATRTPGSDVSLTLTATVTKQPSTSCTATHDSAFTTLRNHVTVHLGEAAMPRFDNRWLYGDLHYHSQGTDNEGESGYNYRGVIRAMGAMGLDFVLAAEHASNAAQILDAEVDLSWCGIKRRVNDEKALRDMSATRFRFLNQQLHDEQGANRTTALDGAGGRLPQGYLSHGVIPQILLGGEIDAIPEIETNDPHIPYGNGLSYDLHDLTEGWESSASWCDFFPDAELEREPAVNGWLVKDVQGLNETDYGREHLIYLPGVGTDTKGFVAGSTGVYGGAGRRLAESHGGRAPLLPEIERKGYAFLAHPLNAGKGSKGPDGPPWSEFMIRKAWRSPGILGFQFWNEPTHLSTNVGTGNSAELGYEFDGNFIDRYANLADAERQGFEAGRFELLPYVDTPTGSFGQWAAGGVESQLHHGAFTWDLWLLRGLDTNETRQLPWLPDGEPRRFFAAAGSDAHGDLNYRRDGYFRGTEKIKDVAIAKARNLVFAGNPTLPRDENVQPESGARPAERHSHDQVVRALADGNFSATDGPALRIVVDRNGNNVIDDGDTPMGGVVELHGEEQLPLLVEWASTAEFGRVTRLSLYLGVRNDRASVDGSSRVYAPALHGPRNSASLPDESVIESYQRGQRTYARMRDNYWRDPTGLLTIDLASTPSLHGQRRIVLPLGAFEPDRNARGDRFYVRAFAETEQQDEARCVGSSTARRRGACIRHYALTNPIWAITKTSIAGFCPPSDRALDRDGDGLPDGCDPRSTSAPASTSNQPARTPSSPSHETNVLLGVLGVLGGFPYRPRRNRPTARREAGSAAHSVAGHLLNKEAAMSRTNFGLASLFITAIGVAGAVTLMARQDGCLPGVRRGFGAGMEGCRVVPAAQSNSTLATTGEAQDLVKTEKRRFGTEAETLQWIADRAQSLRAGEVLRHHDKAGSLIGVTIVSVDPARDARAAEETLLAELGGDDGQILIGKQAIPLHAAPGEQSFAPEDADAAAAPKSHSRCSGELCTDNSSFKNNYYLYRSIGSKTKVTSGSGRRHVASVPGHLLFEVFGRKICSPAATCPTGTSAEDTGQCYFKCYTQTSSAIRLSVTFFAKAPNGLVLPAFQVDPEPFVGTSAEVKLTQWGVLLGSGGVKSQCKVLGGPVECSLVGVCTRHETRNAEGRVTVVTTSAGTTDSCGN